MDKGDNFESILRLNEGRNRSDQMRPPSREGSGVSLRTRPK